MKSEPGLRPYEMVQHAVAEDEVEGAVLRRVEVEQRALDRGDVRGQAEVLGALSAHLNHTQCTESAVRPREKVHGVGVL